jgi:uncharacterized protein (DUF305 family)
MIRKPTNDEDSAMQKRSMLVSTFALALVLSASSTYPALAASDTGRAMSQSSARPAKVPYDVQFLDAMSQHHRDGIKMMQMAADKAKSPDIEEMAQKGIDDQSEEIDEMKSMRKRISPNAPKAANMKLPGMMPKKMMEEDMTKLRSASGSHFDTHFLQAMIKHHQGAVTMSDDALAKARDPEVRSKAKEIHDKQKGEISDMKHMLKTM